MECGLTVRTKVKLSTAMRNVLLHHEQLADAALTDFNNMHDQLFDAVKESEALSDE